jgi:hypothetical protein
MPKAVPEYMRERLEEFQKLTLDLLNNPGTMIEPWLRASTHFPYTGWQPTPSASMQALAEGQRFRVAKSSLRYVRAPNKLILPCDNSVLGFPLTAAPMLDGLSSAPGTFTAHDVIGWGVKPEGLDPKKVMSYLQILVENGLVEVVT